MKASIAYVYNLRIPSELAHSIYVVKSCKAAATLGYRTTLFNPERKQPTHFPYKNIWKYYNIKRDLFLLRKIKTLEIPSIKFSILDKFLKHLRYPLITWSFHLRVLRELLTNRPSIITTSDREIIVLLRIVKLFYAPKVIYAAHIEPKNRYERFLDSLLRSRVDLFVVTVNFLKNYYRSHGISEGRILVTPNGVDLEEYRIKTRISQLRKKFNIPSNKKVIGYIGRFETMGMEKGIFKLMEALFTLKKEDNQVVICVVGGPKKYFKSYREKAKKLGLSSIDVLFIHQVKPELVPYVLKTFDACTLLYPYNHHFAHVMSPMKAIEYMASRKPIVVSDFPSTREIFSESEAFFTKADDLTAIVKSLKEALYNETLVREKTRAAYKKVCKLTWEKREKNILKVLETI